MDKRELVQTILDSYATARPSYVGAADHVLSHKRVQDALDTFASHRTADTARIAEPTASELAQGTAIRRTNADGSVDAIDPSDFWLDPRDARIAELEEALRNMRDHYIRLVDSGDCGSWNPREEAVVIAATTALGGRS